MRDLFRLICRVIADLFQSRAALEAELLVLRQQINVLRRACPKKPPFISMDRLILAGVCRLFPNAYDALAIVRPDTVIPALAASAFLGLLAEPICVVLDHAKDNAQK